MTFYLRAPRGIISWSQVKQLTDDRANFLVNVVKNSSNITDLVQQHCFTRISNCLIEGTIEDRVSHFILRLACSYHTEIESAWVEGELNLFRYRLLCQGKQEWMKMMRELKRHSTELLSERNSLVPKFRNFLQILQDISTQALNITSPKDDNSILLVPFQYALSLVAKREVVISKGIASIPANKFCQFLTDLYKTTLQLSIHQMRRSDTFTYLSSDMRLLSLARHIKAQYRDILEEKAIDSCNKVPWNIPLSEMDSLSQFFPLCMFHLHETLKKENRLRHEDRIQYTLFLKEIGMPLHVAIEFWKHKYSQPSSGVSGSKCTHDWSTNASKYIYGLHHLYGQEGSHVDYKAHSCSTIQNRHLHSGNCGGCPFTHFDKEYLTELLQLKQIPISLQAEIINLSDEGQFSKACSVYLEFLLTMKSEQSSVLSKERPELYDSLADSANLNNSRNYIQNGNTNADISELNNNENYRTEFAEFKRKRMEEPKIFFEGETIQKPSRFYYIYFHH